MPPANCCSTLLQPLIRHASSDAAGSIWAIDVPTWITAIATAGLLVGAYFTARYAIKAFRAQSKEVSDQAAMLRVQSDQLKEQRKINKLQAEDLQASLEERKRLRRIAERGQANDVGFAWWPASHALIISPSAQPPLGTQGGTMAVAHADTAGMSVLVVDNASRRRILDAACRIEPSEGAGLTLAAERVGLLADNLLGSVLGSHRGMLDNLADGSTVPLIRADFKYAFLVRFDLEKKRDARLAARFTDDAGLHWQIDQDLHLQQLDTRDW